MVGAGDRRQRRAVTAIAPEDILQHLLAPVVLEIHIDIRRLIAFSGHETREQHVAFGRVQLGDAQRKADRRVGRRTAPLAENCLLSGETNDVVNG